MTRAVRYHQVLVSPRIGGAENLAIAIHRHAVAVEPGSSELLVPQRSETKRWVESEGLSFREYDLDRVQQRSSILALWSNLRLLTMLQGSGPGILHVHSPYTFAALRPFRTVSRFRTVLHLHLDYPEESLRWPLKLPPDMIIVCAKFMVERVEHALLVADSPGTRIMVAVNAVDTERFKLGSRLHAKQGLGIDKDRPVLLMAANLATHKGQETAIRAVSLLVERGYSPLLWLVGEERESGGSYTKKLRALVAELNISAFVEFLGFRNDVPRLLQAADFLLLPSVQEGLPLAVLEAQASKVVVLAAPTAGIPEVIENGRSGFLIDAYDPLGYANTLASLISNSTRADAVAETAYRRVVSSSSMQRYCERIHAATTSLLYRT